jgi:hypothetical protein
VYADDLAETFREFQRILKTGGKAQAIDSDFAIFAIDSVPPTKWRALVDAAEHAFRTPNIGRKLYGLTQAASFADVQVQIFATPDIKGRMLNFA